MKQSFHRIALAVTTAAALTACGTTTTSGIAGSNRSQLLIVPASEVNQTAALAYKQMNQEARAKGKLITSGAEFNRVNTIMKRIVAQVGHFRPDAARWAWELTLVNDNQINAFAMPGGKISFYTGIIRRLKLTDAEIAAVMGHEIAHALREHSREKISQQKLGGAALAIGGAAAGLSGSSMELAGLAKQLALDLPFSRAMESEADVFGLELAARAGYDPRAAITLWQKMSAASGGGSGPSFLSTHPSDSNRQAELAALMPKVMPLYDASKKQR